MSITAASSSRASRLFQKGSRRPLSRRKVSTSTSTRTGTSRPGRSSSSESLQPRLERLPVGGPLPQPLLLQALLELADRGEPRFVGVEETLVLGAVLGALRDVGARRVAGAAGEQPFSVAQALLDGRAEVGWCLGVQPGPPGLPRPLGGGGVSRHHGSGVGSVVDPHVAGVEVLTPTRYSATS